MSKDGHWSSGHQTGLEASKENDVKRLRKDGVGKREGERLAAEEGTQRWRGTQTHTGPLDAPRMINGRWRKRHTCTCTFHLID